MDSYDYLFNPEKLEKEMRQYMDNIQGTMDEMDRIMAEINVRIAWLKEHGYVSEVEDDTR